jgi:osmotically-inducible protein OsmY
MKAKLYVLSFVASMIAAGAVPAHAADTRLGKRVEERLRQDERLKDYVLEAEVDDGVATLTGKVALDAARELAGELARVPGVRQVDNQIEVAPLTVEERMALQEQLNRQRAQARSEATGVADQAAQPPAAPAADEVPARGQPDEDGFVHLQLPMTPPGDPEKMVSGEAVTRSWLTTRLMTELEGDPALEGDHVEVTVSDDLFVTLKGRVSSETARQRAVQIAKSTKGVREVDDQLTVGVRRPRTPSS